MEENNNDDSQQQIEENDSVKEEIEENGSDEEEIEKEVNEEGTFEADDIKAEEAKENEHEELAEETNGDYSEKNGYQSEKKKICEEDNKKEGDKVACCNSDILLDMHGSPDDILFPVNSDYNSGVYQYVHIWYLRLWDWHVSADTAAVEDQ